MTEAVPLTKLTRAALADQWGALDARADKIKDEIEALKKEFNRRDLTAIKGDKFSVVKTVKPTSAIDTRGIREEMGDAWCDQRSRAGTRTSYEVQSLSDIAKGKK